MHEVRGSTIIPAAQRQLQNFPPFAIVNSSSAAGRKGHSSSVAYCTSNFAVVGLTQVAALEYGTLGIRVNAVNPGYVVTDMTQDVQYGEKAKWIALSRIGQCEERLLRSCCRMRRVMCAACRFWLTTDCCCRNCRLALQ